MSSTLNSADEVPVDDIVEFDTLANSDVSLIACDRETPLKAHRVMLAFASPTLWGPMFDMPQPVEECGELSRVELFEPYKVIESLLCFIYPVKPPSFHSLDALVPVLAAAHKFQLRPHIMQALTTQLTQSRFMKFDALRVYAIADRFSLEPALKAASRFIIRNDLGTIPMHQDLKYMSAYTYHRLIIAQNGLKQKALREMHRELPQHLRGYPHSQYSNASTTCATVVMRSWEHVVPKLLCLDSEKISIDTEWYSENGFITNCQCGENVVASGISLFISLKPKLIALDESI